MTHTVTPPSATVRRRILPFILAALTSVSMVSAAAAGPFDIDGNGVSDAATDGTLILRYEFGFRDTALTAGAIGTGATRTTPAAIEAYFATIAASLDVDGNGVTDALTDGVLVYRYMSGYSGAELIASAVGLNATRSTADAIVAQLATLIGGQVFASALTFSPGTIFRNESTSVTVAVAVAFANGSPTLDLLSTTEAGVGTTKVLTLYDDGDLVKGDDIANDGIFHNKISLAPTDSLDRFYVAKDPVSTQRSPVSRLAVSVRLTNAALTTTMTFNTSIDTLVKLRVSQGQTWPQIRTEVLGQLKANPTEVTLSGLSDDGDGVWWVSKDELLVVVQSSTYFGSTLKGGSSQLQALRQEVEPRPPDNTPRPTQPDLLPGWELLPTRASALAGDTIATGSNRALVLAPYRTYFESHGGDEANEVAQILTDAGYDVTFKQDAQVTVNDFKNLSNYGVLAVSSHGDNYYKGLLTLWFTTFGESIPFWAEGSSQVIVLTNVALTTANKATYEADLKTQRLVLAADNTLAITPSFIKTYAGTMPSTLVYMSSCRSTFNSTMADAFLGRGAKAYLGYSNYVGTPFATSHGMSTFQQLAEGKKTGELTGIGDVDTASQNAIYQLFGVNNLVIIESLRNGTFEIGNLSGWTTEGDTRVISHLGPLASPQGAYMSIISTGLGSVTQSQSRIFQTFKVPANATRLKLRYDVISEEPMEFVGSQFDDKFEVALTPAGQARQILRFESVNTSTWLPISGINFAGGDSTVFHTGFKDVDVDISSRRGQTVTLEIKVYDVGDSIYDTAAVVDNIRIETTATPAPSSTKAVTASSQNVSLSPTSGTLIAGAAAFDVNYMTTGAVDPTLPGLGIRVHFNSARATFSSFSNVLPTGLVGQLAAQADSTNADGDASTDAFVFIGWTDIAGNWPGVDAVRLATANFVMAAGATGVAVFKVSAVSTAATYSLTRVSAMLSPLYTDSTLGIGATPIRAAHIAELRSRINAVRARVGLAAAVWTNDPLVAGVTTVHALHLVQLQTALGAAYQQYGAGVPPFTAITPSTLIRAAHIAELRGFVAILEAATVEH
jgi:hypothetical protein